MCAGGNGNKASSVQQGKKQPMYSIDDKFPGLVTKGNIDIANRPIVKNTDGSISTVRSMGVNIDDKEYLIPTVSDDGKLMDTDEAIQYFRKTGKYLGIFDSPDASDAYAQKLHEQQDWMYTGKQQKEK